MNQFTVSFVAAYLEGDVDGDMRPDFHVQISAPPMHASSLVL